MFFTYIPLLIGVLQCQLKHCCIMCLNVCGLYNGWGGGLSGWFSAEMEQYVIGKAVEAETMVVHDLTKGKHVA